MVVVSFDVDGTMVFGDPAGPIEIEVVRRAKAAGHVVGSGSDRTISDQTQLWERHEVEVDFVSLKHRLADIRERNPKARRYLHIGDTEVDRHYAKLAGFEFCFGHEVEEQEAWLLQL